MPTTTGPVREFTPVSMKSRLNRGRTEKRILVAGRWQRTPQQAALIKVFGRDLLVGIGEASVQRYAEAANLRALVTR